MFLRAIPVIALVTSLSACGGSSDGSAVNPTQPPTADRATVLETFDDGSGVLRAVTTTDGRTFTFNAIGPNIQQAASNINSGGPAVADLINVQINGSNAYGNFLSGQILSEGQLINALGYENYDGTVVIVYAEDVTNGVLITGGEKVSNIPSGTFRYTGTNVVGLRDGSYSEDGTFAMAVNFDTGQAAINGSTLSTTIDASNIAVNNSTGTFSSNNVNLALDGTQTTGTISGNFHGNGAVGVTGIYHDNGGNPVVAGAIAGTR